jgi:hypothetical protein
MTAMADPLSCDYEQAALSHLRDALGLTHAQRWHWLRDAMELGFATACRRAEQGLVTLGPHGEILWPQLSATVALSEGVPP